MLDNSRIASAQCSWSLTGLGSANSLQPHPDTLHRGYGWGRMIDGEFFMEPLFSDFRCTAEQTTASSKERKKTQYPLSWH